MADPCGVPNEKPHTVTIGIDPGMTTGVAGLCSHDSYKHNTWDLKAGDHPLRYLYDQLINLFDTWRPNLVCYEEPVARGMAARSLNRQMGVIILACELRGIPHYPVNPGTLKKHATGSGRADKEQMAEAARVQGWEAEDHNEVDALWLAHYGTYVIAPFMES